MILFVIFQLVIVNIWSDILSQSCFDAFQKSLQVSQGTVFLFKHTSNAYFFLQGSSQLEGPHSSSHSSRTSCGFSSTLCVGSFSGSSGGKVSLVHCLGLVLGDNSSWAQWSQWLPLPLDEIITGRCFYDVMCCFKIILYSGPWLSSQDRIG